MELTLREEFLSMGIDVWDEREGWSRGDYRNANTNEMD